jgi:hypothetical protein
LKKDGITEMILSILADLGEIGRETLTEQEINGLEETKCQRKAGGKGQQS